MHFYFGSFDFHLYNCCCCCLWFNDDANKFWYQTIDEWFLTEYFFWFLMNFWPVWIFFIEFRFFFNSKMTKKNHTNKEKYWKKYLQFHGNLIHSQLFGYLLAVFKFCFFKPFAVLFVSGHLKLLLKNYSLNRSDLKWFAFVNCSWFPM